MRTVAPDVIPEWAQPHGAHDAWPMGAVVTYQGKMYESVVPANVWMPGSSATLWKPIEEEGPAIPQWVQPTGGHDAYAAGAEVMHNGQHWRNTHGNGNVWVPGVYGWVVV